MKNENALALTLADHATFGWDGDAHHRCRCGQILTDKPTTWAIPAWTRHVIDTLATAQRGNLGDEERCHRCGGENVTWSAPSPLWNLVMRGNDINGEPLFGDLVCMGCFVVLAEEAGIKPKNWRLTADPEPDVVVKITPSGRVWDEGSHRWRPRRAMELRHAAEEHRRTANVWEAAGLPETAQKERDRAYALLRDAEAMETQ